jgi:hypothetical protein
METEVIRLRVRANEEVTVTTAGTPVNPTTDTRSEAIRVTNNNTARLVTVGSTAAGSDATTSPKKGTVLRYLESHLMFLQKGGGRDAANEIFIDADTNGTIVTVEHMGV